MSTNLEVYNTKTAAQISSELGFWSRGIYEMKQAFGGWSNLKEYTHIQITLAEEQYEEKLIASRTQ